MAFEHATSKLNSIEEALSIQSHVFVFIFFRKQSEFVATDNWYNFHRVFPWDYKHAELNSYNFNHTKAFIDFFAKIGWAYEMKSVSQEIIDRRAKRTGSDIIAHDKSDGMDKIGDEIPIWGWGDHDMNKDDEESAIILEKKDE